MSIDALKRVAGRLGDVVVGPGLWPDLLDEASRAIGARGAVLLQSDVRTPDVPMTLSVNDAVAPYFRDGWHERDLRARYCVPKLMQGAAMVREQNCIDTDLINRSAFYNECLIPGDIPWFVGVAVWAGRSLWIATFQRRARQGPFSDAECERLATLTPHLTQAATLSTLVGRQSLVGVTNALDRVARPAVALDRLGRVLEANSLAASLFDGDLRLRSGILVFADAKAQAEWSDFLLYMRASSDGDLRAMTPIVVRRSEKAPLVVRALPVEGAARNPFLGARIILVFSDLDRESAIDGALLRRLFGLSAAETRVALLVGQGRSVDDAAETLGLARETIRNQLKAIYLKTATSRQAELVALLARLG